MSSTHAARELRARVLRALDVDGYFERPLAPRPAIRPEEPDTGDPEEAAAAYLLARATESAPSAIQHLGCTPSSWFSVMRSSLGEDKAPPVSIFHREKPTAAKERWKKAERSANTIRLNVATVVDLWGWAAEEPVRRPGVPSAPNRTKGLAPRVPRHSRATRIGDVAIVRLRQQAEHDVPSCQAADDHKVI